MKKGFTLIELLAVIVILAIIAVIAVPIVLNIIDESKDNATLRSADFYLDAVEFSVANSTLKDKNIQDETYPIMENGNICIGELSNKECVGDILEVEVNGETPTSGNITITNGNITGVELFLNGKKIVKNAEGKLVFSNSENIGDGVGGGNDEDESETVALINASSTDSSYGENYMPWFTIDSDGVMTFNDSLFTGDELIIPATLDGINVSRLVAEYSYDERQFSKVIIAERESVFNYDGIPSWSGADLYINTKNIKLTCNGNPMLNNSPNFYGTKQEFANIISLELTDTNKIITHSYWDFHCFTGGTSHVNCKDEQIEFIYRNPATECRWCGGAIDNEEYNNNPNTYECPHCGAPLYDSYYE